MLPDRNFNSLLSSFFEEFNTFPKELTVDGSFEVEVLDEGDNYLVKSKLAGVEKENIGIDVEKDILKINVKSTKEKKDKRKNVLYSEFYSGSQSRSLKLQDIDPENIDAEFTNGILTISVGKLKTKKKNKIQIK